MSIRKKLTYLLVFVLGLGLGLGIAITYHPASAVPAALYKATPYFSPNGGVASQIIKAINDSKFTIDLAIFDLTSQDITSVLEKAKNRGMKIRIIADSRQAKGSNSMISALQNAGLNIKITHGEGRGIMHNKFAIFDSKLMVTGSYNWTNNAERFNYENAIFITDPNIIKEYQKDFDVIWKSSPNVAEE